MLSEEIVNDFLFYLQLCLAVWQFIKLTPVGALIKGGIGWLLPLRLSPTYYRLQECPGRAFKRANFFMLQTDIPAEGRDITPSIEVRRTDNTIDLGYLGSKFELEKKKGGDGTMLLVSEVFCKEKGVEKRLVASYYITDRIWKKLQHLKQVLSYGSDGPPSHRAYIADAAAKSVDADAKDVEAKALKAEAKVQNAEAEAEHIDWIAAQCNSAYYNATYGVAAEDATDARVVAAHYTLAAGHYNFAARAARANVDPSRAAAEFVREYRVVAAYASKAREDADAASNAAERAKEAAASQATLVVEGKKEFWRNMITGGVMTLEEVCDAIILDNQHVSTRLSNDWLLPINLSLSEERLLKILNLFALFLQTKKVVKVHWSIPTSLSCISALLEFSTTIRLRLYSKINVLFCYIMHSICDRLPRSWRRQVYSLGNWVETLKPSNDIRVKVVKGKMCAIISEGAKVDKVDKEGTKIRSLSCITALLEFSTKIRLRLYSKINVFMHSICDRLPPSWRPSVPDKQGVSESAKVDKQGAEFVPLFVGDLTAAYGVVEKQFPCDAIKDHIKCAYLTERQMCEISAPGFSPFFVKCKDDNDEFRRIITLVKCIADNGCGSLISCCDKNRVRVRGFEETVTSYVNSGLPDVYTLELGDVRVI